MATFEISSASYLDISRKMMCAMHDIALTMKRLREHRKVCGLCKTARIADERARYVGFAELGDRRRVFGDKPPSTRAFSTMRRYTNSRRHAMTCSPEELTDLKNCLGAVVKSFHDASHITHVKITRMIRLLTALDTFV